MKRTGTLVAVAMAGMLSLSPLALAGEKPSSGDTSHSHYDSYKHKHKKIGHGERCLTLEAEGEAEAQAEGVAEGEGEAEGAGRLCLPELGAFLGALG